MLRPGNRFFALVFWLSTRTPSPGQCASTTLPNISEDATDDYDIHIPLSEIPLGVNVGPSLEVLSFAKDPRTGELPWVARRGWLEVGDVLVSLVSHEGEYMSEFSPGEFAEAMRKVVESKQADQARKRQISNENEGGFITLRVRPGNRPGRAIRTHGMYSPRSKAEVDQEQARWHLSYSIGLLSAGKVDVTLAAFGGEPKDCAAFPIVIASPEDGCAPLRNTQQVEGAHVLVRRGGCSFLAKALAVSNSGGRSLVVVDEGAGRLRMEAEQGAGVDIPVVMISKQDGGSLKKAVASTSRATGNVTASLVVTAACLSQGAEPPKPSPGSEIPPSQVGRRGRRLSSAGTAPLSSRAQGTNAEKSGPDAEEARPATRAGSGPPAVGPAVDKAATGKRGAASASGATNPDEPGASGVAAAGDAAAASPAVASAVIGASGVTGGGGGQRRVPAPPECRERSSGKLRGGDLILTSSGMREGTVSIVAEFLSTFVTGLLSTDRLDMTASTPDSPDKGPGNEADASLIVVTLSGDCNDNPGLKHWEEKEDEATTAMTTTKGAREDALLFLPPTTACSVERQIELGERLGAAVLVVVAEGTDDSSIIPVVSSATASVFTANATGDTGSPTYNNSAPASRLPLRAPAGKRREGHQAGENLAQHASEEEPRRDGGRRGRGERVFGGDERGRSARRKEVNGDCPPLTIVLSHDEGERVFKWLDQVGGVVTARVVEREEVGKLWGDVVWASDPANWPKGIKQRRRILNRLRKTHSPKHSGKGTAGVATTSRSRANETRWSLIERYARAAEEMLDDDDQSSSASISSSSSSSSSRSGNGGRISGSFPDEL